MYAVGQNILSCKQTQLHLCPWNLCKSALKMFVCLPSCYHPPKNHPKKNLKNSFQGVFLWPSGISKEIRYFFFIQAIISQLLNLECSLTRWLAHQLNQSYCESRQAGQAYSVTQQNLLRDASLCQRRFQIIKKFVPIVYYLD